MLNKHGPILPVPYLFHQILMEEKVSVSRTVWYFMAKSLESGTNEIECSASRLSKYLGVNSVQTAFDALKEGREKGYIKRVSEGVARKPGVKPKSASYRVNWDFLEQGTEVRVRKAYRLIVAKFNLNSHAITDDTEDMAKIMTTQDAVRKAYKKTRSSTKKGSPSIDEVEKNIKVRRGRFGDTEVFAFEDWKTKGKTQVASYIGRVLAKIKQKSYTSITPAELWRYFQYKYQKTHEEKYVGNMGVELYEIKKMMLQGVTQRDFIKMTRWLFSGQEDFDTPTVRLMATNWRQKIFSEAEKYAKSKSNKKKKRPARRILNSDVSS